MLDRGRRLSTALARLAGAAEVGPHDIAVALGELDAAVRLAVSSSVGLHLRLTVDACLLTFGLFLPAVAPDGLTASARIPLEQTEPTTGEGGGDGSSATTLVLYASAPGAFIDLAADLTFSLGLGPPVTGVDDRPAGARPRVVHLDADLPPASTATTVTGLDAFDLVNQAVGVLIDRGLTPEEARTELATSALDAGVDLPARARQVLEARQPPDPESDSAFGGVR